MNRRSLLKGLGGAIAGLCGAKALARGVSAPVPKVEGAALEERREIYRNLTTDSGDEPFPYSWQRLLDKHRGEASRIPDGTLMVWDGDMPIGYLCAWHSSADEIPDGWLPCNGRSLRQCEYPELFDVAGRRWGGDKEFRLFHLPDYDREDNGRFIIKAR